VTDIEVAVDGDRSNLAAGARSESDVRFPNLIEDVSGRYTGGRVMTAKG
jgi:hypothetical protein